MGESMLTRTVCILLELLVILAMTDDTWSQGSLAPDRVVVSYPSKSITSFPILETAQRVGFFRRENLDVSAVYMVFEFFSPGLPQICRNAGADFVLYDMTD